MKRLKLCLIILLSFLLTGCTEKIDITEDQDDAIAEYMAGMLLGNDKDYTQDLIPIDQISADNTDADSSASEDNTIPEADNENSEDAATVAQGSDKVNDNSATVDNEDSDYSLAEVLGVKNFDIQYESYKVTDTYPEDQDNSYFSLISSKDCQLLVITFSVENKTSKKQELNLSDAGIDYRLDINDKIINKPEMTLLENDLQYIDISIKGKDKTEAVLVYEISNAADLSDAILIVSKDNKSKTIEIK